VMYVVLIDGVKCALSVAFKGRGWRYAVRGRRLQIWWMSHCTKHAVKSMGNIGACAVNAQ